ncbi:MAG TPA: UPF0280 family protein [Burkholderiales bacterium]
MSGPARARLGDGRLHLQHGPIDLVIDARGVPAEVETAYAQAAARFDDVLEGLVSELPLLRAPLGEVRPPLRGPVARRMLAATWPHRATFVTPMAAVAGAVADEVLAALVAGRALERACVNDGGDIAFYVSGNAHWDVGVVENPLAPSVGATLRIDAVCPARGVATSGWRGRSHSLGIADAVTVMATDAAAADVAATLIANAVNIDHSAIERKAANALQADSDLGERPVTVAVGALPTSFIDAALDAGLARATALRARGLIHAAFLSLQGHSCACATAPLPAPAGRTLIPA